MLRFFSLFWWAKSGLIHKLTLRCFLPLTAHFLCVFPEGCNHMTCTQCGFEFCWHCRIEWGRGMRRGALVWSIVTWKAIPDLAEDMRRIERKLRQPSFLCTNLAANIKLFIMHFTCAYLKSCTQVFSIQLFEHYCLESLTWETSSSHLTQVSSKTPIATHRSTHFLPAEHRHF